MERGNLGVGHARIMENMSLGPIVVLSLYAGLLKWTFLD